MSAPRQVTLARLAELGLRPDRELGQHFLVDDNLLGVIERLAELRPDDVALEIGAGVGTLTAFLADRCAHVQAIEIDRRLEEALTRTLGERSNVTVHWGDAMRLDLAALQPTATAFVANLPYHVAAPLILESIGGLPAVDRWCVLVQREIAERLVAAPGSALYGAPSVLSALALEPTGRHAVSRSVFVPVPNVDSSLVAFRRRPEWGELAGDWPAIVATVRAAFAYRRKTLVNALVLAGWGPDRGAVEAACRAAGIDAKARAETLPGEVFVTLAVGAAVIAGVKINLSLRVGRRRDDGYHGLATVLVALPVGDDLELEPARATDVEAPALAGGDALVARALGLLAVHAGHDAGWRVRIDKRTPVGAGLGGGSADAGLALRLANATLGRPLAPAALIAVAAEVGSDVPFFAAGYEAAIARGRGEVLEPCPIAAAAWVVLAWPGEELSTAAVYARYQPLDGADARVGELVAAPFAAAGAEQLAALVENDLAAPAEQLCPAATALRLKLLAGGALTASVSGSGSAVFGLFASRRAAEAGRVAVAGAAAWTAVAPLPGGDPAATITA